jgi:hypothetical protein
MKRWAIALVLVSGWVTACGSRADSHAGSVSGTFAGSAVAVSDTTAFTGTAGNSAYLGEVLASVANVCSLLQQRAAKANVSGLSLLIQNVGVDAAPAAIAPGAYSITHGAPAKDTNGNMLVVSATSDASAGTINIDSVSPNVSGSFDLTFPNGDHLSGSFASEVCDAPGPTPMNTAAAAPPVCQP